MQGRSKKNHTAQQQENASPQRFRIPGIGERTIKTAIVVLLCMLLFSVMTSISQRIPESWPWVPRGLLSFLLYRPNPIFACIAGVVAMQPRVEDSRRMGRSRVLGTAIGGILGLAFLLLDSAVLGRRLNTLFATVGVVVVIYCCLLLKQNRSIAIAVVTFLIIMITLNEDFPYLYAIHRMIDTTIGVGVSLLVNALLWKPNDDSACGAEESANAADDLQELSQKAETISAETQPDTQETQSEATAGMDEPTAQEK